MQINTHVHLFTTVLGIIVRHLLRKFYDYED